MVTIILADDHKIIRKGLNVLLSSETDLKVIGEANDGLEAINLAETLKPDVLVLDLMMRGINGLEVIRRMEKCLYRTGIVVLSMHSNEAYVREAFHLGARAYVLKEASSDELIIAIREVSAGRFYLSSQFSGYLVTDPLNICKSESRDSYKQLTSREQEVLLLIAQGKEKEERRKEGEEEKKGRREEKEERREERRRRRREEKRRKKGREGRGEKRGKRRREGGGKKKREKGGRERKERKGEREEKRRKRRRGRKRKSKRRKIKLSIRMFLLVILIRSGMTLLLRLSHLMAIYTHF